MNEQVQMKLCLFFHNRKQTEYLFKGFDITEQKQLIVVANII